MRKGSKTALAGLFCFFVVLSSSIGSTPAGNNSGSPTAQPSRTLRNKDAKSNYIQREGTRLAGREGYFRIAGSRVVFFSKERNHRYVVLENLNLERIAETLADQPSRRHWEVTGILSEYRGENYLLIEKAVLKSWDSTIQTTP